MKKLYLTLLIIVLDFLIIVIIYSSLKEVNVSFYTLRENYSFVYSEGRKMEFDIYSLTKRPLIEQKSLNSYKLITDEYTFNLDDIDIESKKNNNVYQITLITEIPYITDNEYKSSTLFLEITNSSYKLKLDLGTISILNENNYKLLALDYLAPTYSIYKGSYELAGINLKLSYTYSRITTFRIGNFSYGYLPKALFNKRYEVEDDIDKIIINYNHDKVKTSYACSLLSKSMFIPITYLNDYLIRGGYIVINLDNEYYYFDYFMFMESTPSFNSYKDKMCEGVYVDAKD